MLKYVRIEAANAILLKHGGLLTQLYWQYRSYKAKRAEKLWFARWIPTNLCSFQLYGFFIEYYEDLFPPQSEKRVNILLNSSGLPKAGKCPPLVIAVFCTTL